MCSDIGLVPGCGDLSALHPVPAVLVATKAVSSGPQIRSRVKLQRRALSTTMGTSRTHAYQPGLSQLRRRKRNTRSLGQPSVHEPLLSHQLFLGRTAVCFSQSLHTSVPSYKSSLGLPAGGQLSLPHRSSEESTHQCKATGATVTLGVHQQLLP